MADFHSWVVSELPDAYRYAPLGPVRPAHPDMRGYAFMLCRPEAVDRLLLVYAWHDEGGTQTERRFAPDGR